MRLQMTIVPSRKGPFRKSLSIFMVEYYISTFYLSSNKKENRPYFEIFTTEGIKNFLRCNRSSARNTKKNFFLVPVYY